VIKKQQPAPTRQNLVWPTGPGAVRAVSFPVCCPRCGSQRTRLVAHGSTARLRQVRCLTCHGASILLNAAGTASTCAGE
jgi:hypothetical protein